MQSITCNVSSIEKLNSFLYRIFLQPTEPVVYKAGQYLSVIMGEGDKRHFSIANAPCSKQIELHIGAQAENKYAMQVIEKMQNEGKIEAEVGLGEAYLREESKRPIILVAGGTGFAYMKSIFEQIAQLQLENTVYLFWGVKESADFYFQDEALEWAEKYANVHFYPVVEFPQGQWQGHQGYVHQAVLDEFSELSGFDIYIVGRFEMAKVARHDFMKKGALQDRIFGDAFAFI